ncbi:hypothetical protein HYC85_025232 [Camellia sinensis]|uniref:Cytokinin riboside 5'-monophosphate phosphoribohydrolase n=1 Tax=Camellia sinensis TaxID=4442 RepID=A0A7J7GEF9_CAMSI|nr:hypothetical protein HYC85_025232 [Camellia sinensis]
MWFWHRVQINPSAPYCSHSKICRQAAVSLPHRAGGISVAGMWQCCGGEEDCGSVIGKEEGVSVLEGGVDGYGLLVGEEEGKGGFRGREVPVKRISVSRNIDLVYGGGSIGLMGLISQAVHDGGRHVIGVIPKTLMPREIYSDPGCPFTVLLYSGLDSVELDVYGLVLNRWVKPWSKSLLPRCVFYARAGFLRSSGIVGARAGSSVLV